MTAEQQPMTAIESRLWTLKQIIDFAEKEQKQYEGLDFVKDGEHRKYIRNEYFALQTVIDECNRLIKHLKYDNKRS